MSKGMSDTAKLLAVVVLVGFAGYILYSGGYIPKGTTGQSNTGTTGTGLGTTTQTTSSTGGGTGSTGTVQQVQQQSTAVTGTFGLYDALQTSSGKVWLANYLMLASGSQQLANLTLTANAAGGTQGLTYNQITPITYTAWGETNSSYYGTVVTFAVANNDPNLVKFGNNNPAAPTFAIPETKIGEAQVAVWEPSLINGLVNSTYATTSYVNFSAPSTNVSLPAGGTLRTFIVKAQEPNNFQAFGDSQARSVGGIPGIIVCTDAKQTTYSWTTTATSVPVPAIGSSNGMLYCWAGSVDQLTTANSPADLYKFTVGLNSGQSFTAWRMDIYDGTSFLSTDGIHILWGYNDQTTAFNDIGSANPRVCVTQQVTAFETGC